MTKLLVPRSLRIPTEGQKRRSPGLVLQQASIILKKYFFKNKKFYLCLEIESIKLIVRLNTADAAHHLTAYRSCNFVPTVRQN